MKYGPALLVFAGLVLGLVFLVSLCSVSPENNDTHSGPIPQDELPDGVWEFINDTEDNPAGEPRVAIDPDAKAPSDHDLDFGAPLLEGALIHQRPKFKAPSANRVDATGVLRVLSGGPVPVAVSKSAYNDLFDWKAGQFYGKMRRMWTWGRWYFVDDRTRCRVIAVYQPPTLRSDPYSGFHHSEVLLLDGLHAGRKGFVNAYSIRTPRDTFRTWTAGTHTTVARFAGIIGNMVRLKKKNGKTVSVPLEKLSEADQKWIKQRRQP